MNKDALLSGSLHSLSHSASLIEAAAVLFGVGKASSSYVLAISAREELGRCNLLYREAIRLGANAGIEPAILSKKLEDHTLKLQAGHWSSAVRIPLELLNAWHDALVAEDAPLARSLSKTMHRASKQQRNQAANASHRRRLEAQYVDPRPNGTWSTPSTITSEEAESSLHIVLADIANTLAAVHTAAGLQVHVASVSAESPLPRAPELARRVRSAMLARGTAI